MSEKSPCLEKNCSWCCNPVKIGRRKGMANELKIPKDSEGNDIWVKTGEEWAPENNVDTDRVDIYECKNFNKETGLCEDYENRPNICRNTSCVKENDGRSIDEQHKQLTEAKFIVTKKKI